ncbi:hypothetical protein C8R45DRAFT_1094779 [Mycena sanguinolenta]|nr:hypothetical protein C8R45DRAFT_1094779 [Mycena sanguinolenta]
MLLFFVAIEFHPSSGPEASEIIVEPDAIALLLFPDLFNASFCDQTTAVEYNSLVRTMPVLGIYIYISCKSENVALSTEAYIVLGAPEETTIDVIYLLPHEAICRLRATFVLKSRV